MAYVYILYSKTIDKYYTGSCKNLNLRIQQHKEKSFENSFTAIANDWTLFLSIDNLSQESARKIEAHIKRMKSRKFIQDLRKFPELREKLIRRYLNG